MKHMVRAQSLDSLSELISDELNKIKTGKEVEMNQTIKDFCIYLQKSLI